MTRVLLLLSIAAFSLAAQADDVTDPILVSKAANITSNERPNAYQFKALSHTQDDNWSAPFVSDTYTLAPNQEQLATRNGRAVRYDADGNLLSEKVMLDGLPVARNFTYHPQSGRLKTLSLRGILKATYEYDYAWRRISKTLTAPPAKMPATILFQYNPNGQLTEEIAGSGPRMGETLVRYVWIDDTPSAIVFAPNTPSNPSDRELKVYLEVDLLNTPRMASDSEGRTLWQWNIDPYGLTRPDEDPDGDGQSIQINLRFPGHYFDTESGLHYTIMRYYDPSIGRYIQPNPIGPDGEFDTKLFAMDGQAKSSASEGPELRRTPRFPTREEHVNRNKYNTCPKKKPNLSVMCSAYVEDTLDSLASKVNEGHLKWRDSRGNECAYDAQDNLLPDQDANYTFNYGPEPESIEHMWMDVVPHFFYGGPKAYTPNLTTVLP